MTTVLISLLCLAAIFVAVYIFRSKKKAPISTPFEPDIKFTVRYNGSPLNPVDVLLYNGDLFLGLKCIYADTSGGIYNVVYKHKHSELIDTHRFTNIVECVEKAKEILIDTYTINHERPTEIQLPQKDGPVA